MEWNRQKRNDYQRQWVSRNPDKIKAIRHRHWLNHKEHILWKSKAWREAHKERCVAYTTAWRKKHPDVARRWNRDYMRRHKEKSIEWAHVQRVRRQQRIAMTTWTDCRPRIRYLNWREKFCHWCCIVLDLNNRSIDHVVPVSRGGFHEPDNLVASCITCNKSKSDKLVEEWTWEPAA